MGYRAKHILGMAVAILGGTGLAGAGSLAQEKALAPQAPNHDHAGVVSRGDHAMGFSHETTTHHFQLYKTGGGIEVSANDAKDTASRDQIRMHLSHIANLFAAGDFNVPMFIHDTTPPGAAVMSKLRGQIRYQYQETGRGAKILITTANLEAAQAIHDFLRFQITDHRTGDSLDVSPTHR
jgi:hypothetical protein